MKPIPDTLASLIEVAINRYLGLDAVAKSTMSTLSGKTIEVRLRDAGVNFFLCAAQDGIKVVSQYDAEVDTTMTASILSLARIGIVNDSADSMFSGDIEIIGDAALGQQFHGVLKSVQIDWEEIISTYFGDIAAHQIGNSMRALARWGKNAFQSLSLDTTEYLQEESRQLPTSREMQAFLSNVDIIRMDVDRAEARVKRLVAYRQSLSHTEANQSPPINNAKQDVEHNKGKNTNHRAATPGSSES